MRLAIRTDLRTPGDQPRRLRLAEQRRQARGLRLRDSASDDAQAIRELKAGEPFAILDDSLGWAWGYAGKDRRVGYVRSEALRG